MGSPSWTGMSHQQLNPLISGRKPQVPVDHADCSVLQSLARNPRLYLDRSTIAAQSYFFRIRGSCRGRERELLSAMRPNSEAPASLVKRLYLELQNQTKVVDPLFSSLGVRLLIDTRGLTFSVTLVYFSVLSQPRPEFYLVKP